MPKITNTHEIQITPERFLNACTDLELFELDNLLSRPIYQNRISGMFGDIKAEHSAIQPAHLHEGHKCIECKRNWADPANDLGLCPPCHNSLAPTYKS